MYQIGITRFSDTKSNKDIIVDILGNMLVYLDVNYIKVERLSDPRERLRRSRELQRLAANVNEYYVYDWVEGHDVIRLLTLSGQGAVKAIGILAGYTLGRSFVIDTLYVGEDFRRFGAATTGLRTLISELSVSGYVNLVTEEPYKWMLQQTPLDVIEFLREIGFVQTDTGIDNCKWAYTLKEA